jgi:hypothetical protein
MCNTTSIPDDTSPPTEDVLVEATTERTESASIVVGAEEELKKKEYAESVGKLIQDLAHANANAAVEAFLKVALRKDKKKCEKMQAVGGCYALVHLMKNCLDKAIGRKSASEKVTELNVQRSSSRIRSILARFASFALLCALVTGASGGCVWYRRWLETQVGVTRAPCDSVLPTTSSYSCEIFEGVEKMKYDSFT